MHKAIKVRAKSDPWSKITGPLEHDIKELEAIKAYLDIKDASTPDPVRAYDRHLHEYYQQRVSSPPAGSRPAPATHPEWFEFRDLVEATDRELAQKRSALGEAYLAKRSGEDALVWKLSR